jgi:iron complex outermembrane receptor protein
VYKNAGLTFRQGLEASIDAQLENNFRLYGAYTYLDAQFDTAYTSQLGANEINVGNRIPGTYRQQLYGELAWKYPALKFNTALEGRYNSKVFVNDTNTDFADSYTLFNLRAGFNQDVSNWKFSEYLRVENIFDKEYIGSVKINDSNSRFFEASPTRNYLMGLNATYKF